MAETAETSYVIVPEDRADGALEGKLLVAPDLEHGMAAHVSHGTRQAPASGIAACLEQYAAMFYRVVAVAEDGTRSGPSDYAQAPGPIIFTAVPAKIPYGQATTIQMRALASIGNLQSRALDGKSYQGAFGLNADELRWSIHSDVHAEIDPKTGRDADPASGVGPGAGGVCRHLPESARGDGCVSV